MKTTTNILIISTNALGDAFLSCSAIEPLNKFFKKVKIDFIANSNCKFFLKYAGINNIYYLNKRTIDSIIKLIFQISWEKYDYVFCFFPGLINTLFYFITNSIFKYGFINYFRLKEWHDISQNLYINNIKSESFIWKPEFNFLERIKIALSASGVETEYVKKYIFPIQIENCNKNNSILLSFSSRNKNKCLTYELTIKLIEYFCKNKHLIINVLDTENNLNDLRKYDNLYIYNNPNLCELIRLIEKCNLFIGVDSFALHIADAYNANILGLFAPTNPASVFQFELNKYHFVRKKNISEITLPDIIRICSNINNTY